MSAAGVSTRRRCRVWLWWHARRHGQIVVRKHDRVTTLTDTPRPIMTVIVTSTAHCACGSNRIVGIDVAYGVDAAIGILSAPDTRISRATRSRAL